LFVRFREDRGGDSLFFLAILKGAWLPSVIDVEEALAVRLSVPILAYHHIADPEAEGSGAGRGEPIGKPSAGDGEASAAHSAERATYLSPARFERQVDWLRRLGYQSVSVAQVARALQGREGLPRRAVAFTFDDGWLDVFANAFPLLRDAGFTATVFLVGQALGQRGIAFAESRNQAVERLMSVDQVRQLADAGWEIGAHSNTHIHLTRVSEDEARRDIDAGRQAIEAKIGVKPTVFAYPYGDVHGGLARVVEALGFDAACSTVPGRVHRPEERFVLRRVPIRHEMSLARFLYSARLRRYRKGDQLMAKRLAGTWS
jgi:peptidoglycan/xylan/chitin deacetylase (PgdA/CDA1 family)